MPQSPLSKLGKYEIRRELGKGAMGVVYLAYDPVLEREVALKVMASAIVSDDELKQRFEREAKAVARLQHPNIVTVYDLGYDAQGAPFIAMELLKGTDLEQRLRHNLPPLPQKLEIAAQACRGLGHAHRNGIVHRDVKPANIFVTEAGDIKIMDFGVARWTQSSQTQSGAILGTADYMSPEQIRGQKVDGRSDIFGMGIILYRMLSLKKPFRGENIQAVFYQVLNARPPELVLPDGGRVPELQRIVERALAKEEADRYQTAEEMARDIEEVRNLLRAYPARLAGDTIFETAAVDSQFAEGQPTPSEGPRRGVTTLRPGAESPRTGRLHDTAPGGVSRTYRPPAGTGVAPTASRPPGEVTARQVTSVPAGPTSFARPTGVAAPTRLAPPVVARRPRRSPLLLVGGLAVAVGAGVAAFYWLTGPPVKPAGQEATASVPSPPAQDLEARFQFAQELLDRGRIAQAFDAVENILAIQPGNPRARELKERIMKAADEQKTPGPVTTTVPLPVTVPPQVVRPSAPGPAEQAQQKAFDAAIAINGGQLDRAASLINEGERLDPSSPRWAELRRQLQARREEVQQKALEQKKEAHAADFLKQGLASLEAGNYGQAIASLKKALEYDPDNPAVQNALTQATLLKQQEEMPKRPPAVVARQIIESKTELIEATEPGDTPKGFELGAGVKVEKATAAPAFPAQIIIELNPPDAQPGQPYVLRVRLFNEGNSAIQVKSLELVGNYGGKSVGKGQPIAVRSPRINPKSTALLHEAQGTWTEAQNQGSIVATVSLVGDKKLTKTIRW